MVMQVVEIMATRSKGHTGPGMSGIGSNAISPRVVMGRISTLTLGDQWTGKRGASSLNKIAGVASGQAGFGRRR